jgi:hypothetical protein
MGHHLVGCLCCSNCCNTERKNRASAGQLHKAVPQTSQLMELAAWREKEVRFANSQKCQQLLPAGRL